MSDPTTQTTESDAERRSTEQRNLTRAYKRCFASEDGRIVLADLKKKYGFDPDGIENDDFVYGCTATDMAYRTGNKSPLRYVMKMVAKQLPVVEPKKRLRKARSDLPVQP